MVRWAGDGEKMTTLDDAERTLDSDMGLICDDDGPTSIAGIMGGQRSEVQPTTTRVLMEAANWNGPNLHRTSQRLNLRTEASARFEKGLAPEITMWGQAVSTQLMLELTGARLVRRAPSTSAAKGRRRRRSGCATRRSPGCSAPRCRSASRPSCSSGWTSAWSTTGDGLDVTVPPVRRNDVTREVDLIEEVARLWGLDKLPRRCPPTARPGG